MIQTKQCKQCKEEQAVGLCFRQSKNSDDGFFPICNSCVDKNREEQFQRWTHYHASDKPSNGQALYSDLR